MIDRMPRPMDLHGQALLDYRGGEADAEILLRRDDGFLYPPIPARHWFYEDGLPEFDRTALSRCTGRVLELGAAAGSHTLTLQDRGLEITAVDASPQAVEVMRLRGVRDARVGDVFDIYEPPYDSVLVLCNIGIVGDLEGLDRFLAYVRTVLRPGGRLITDSIDPRDSSDELYRAYAKRKADAGRYPGERTLRFEYKGRCGPWFEWVHIDPDTLGDHARQAGLAYEVVAADGRRFLGTLAVVGPGGCGVRPRYRRTRLDQSGIAPLQAILPSPAG